MEAKTPTTEPAQRIAIMFKRRLTTNWSKGEIKTYKLLFKAGCFDTLNDLDLLERYYAFERRKGDNGIHRRDLATFLNNYYGELDRARLWDAQFRRPKPKRKQLQEQTSDDEWRRIGDIARDHLNDLRRQMGLPTREKRSVPEMDG